MHPITLGRTDALLIVDVQNDFLPGGGLAVERGDEVIEPINRLIGLYGEHGLPVYASRDWHPLGHCSFKDAGGPWTPHCIAHTPGAAFPDALALPPSAVIISKARTRGADAYSAFGGTALAGQLRLRGIERLAVCGLATDYCVLNTVRDALALGFDVLLVQDAIRAVEVEPGDGKRAVASMRARGAVPVRLTVPGAYGEPVLIADEALAHAGLP
jgi:nicotinamidase/pyrazinamidase